MSTAMVLPESAPFTTQQRAWLSGFFAGLINIQASAMNGSSMNGTSTTGASASEDTTAGGATSPAVEEDFPWHDPALSMDERLKLADGKPPARQLMAAMAQLDCGACGYLCQTYSEAIATGSEKDLTRCTPGGKDTNKKLKELLKVLPLNGAGVPAAGGETKTAKPAETGGAPSYSRDNPFPARLVKAAT